jgi:hypothetical protein
MCYLGLRHPTPEQVWRISWVGHSYKMTRLSNQQAHECPTQDIRQTCSGVGCLRPRLYESSGKLSLPHRCEILAGSHMFLAWALPTTGRVSPRLSRFTPSLLLTRPVVGSAQARNMCDPASISHRWGKLILGRAFMSLLVRQSCHLIRIFGKA